MNSSIAKVSVGFGGGLAGGWLMSKLLDKLKSESMNEVQPEKWIRVGTISQLIIYPVKSLSGTHVEEATVTSLGLSDEGNPGLRDRVFLITNENLDFKTQRHIPSLALIQVTIKNNQISLRLNNEPGEEITVLIPDIATSKKLVARIWGDKVQAVDCGDEVAKWITRVAESEEALRLVYHASETSQRKVRLDQSRFHTFSSRDLATFQDETSYMLMSEESLSALNEKLENPITVRSFRPSILMNGVPEPWAEDFWSFIRIGKEPSNSPIFKVSRPCVRCKLTTIDPDTGKIREDGEPLKTLSAMKRQVGDDKTSKIVEKSAIMGTHFGLLEGENLTIRVGDPIYAALL